MTFKQLLIFALVMATILAVAVALGDPPPVPATDERPELDGGYITGMTVNTQNVLRVTNTVSRIPSQMIVTVLFMDEFGQLEAVCTWRTYADSRLFYVDVMAEEPQTIKLKERDTLSRNFHETARIRVALGKTFHSIEMMQVYGQ